MDDPEQRLAEALRARAVQTGGRPVPPPAYRPAGAAPFPASHTGSARAGQGLSTPAPLKQVGWALLIALLAGAVLGCGLGLLSVLVPGLLPPLG
jgi:hypothetical protein